MAITAKVMIKTVNLGKTVSTSEGQLTILKGIDIEIKRSESVAIVGASGSGKTTLLSLLAGLDTPSEGQIFLGEEEITAFDEEQRALMRGRMVGFVFQTFQLLGSLTAIENVMLPAELKRDPQAEPKARELLRRVGLEHRMQHYPRQLSGGEQQRVNIARGFVRWLPLMLLDEPTASLDAANRRIVIDLIREARTQGSAIVGIFHDQEVRDALADRLVEV